MSLRCRRVVTVLGIVAVAAALGLLAMYGEPGSTKPLTPPESLYQPAGE